MSNTVSYTLNVNGQSRNVDVAPTVAALLGLKMENIEGRVLTEALLAR